MCSSTLIPNPKYAPANPIRTNLYMCFNTLVPKPKYEPAHPIRTTLKIEKNNSCYDTDTAEKDIITSIMLGLRISNATRMKNSGCLPL